MGVRRYLVPARAVTVETEVRRSRFRCRLERVSTEDEALAVVGAARRQDRDARHHCSAFVLGPGAGDAAGTARSSDDGEPSGTAGAPMLQVLQGAQVHDVVAVVTRWFGGVLLGAGGLVRAYGDAVRLALDEAGTVERRLSRLYTVTAGHADAARLENDLRARGVVVREVVYAQRVTLTLAVPGGLDLRAMVAELSNGDTTASSAGQEWVDPPCG